MNTDSLPGSRGRPLWIVLDNAIDGFIHDINEFALRGVIGIQTENLCIRILGSGSRRRTDPCVGADDPNMIGERIAIRRTSEGSSYLSGLVVLPQLVAADKVD